MGESDGRLDDAVSNYYKIAALPQPKERERNSLYEWIKSSALGGGCRFLGLDLSGFEQPSVYDALYQKDLAFLSDGHGEDDPFTNFIKGPALDRFQKIWKFAMVRQFALFLAISLSY